MGNRYLVVSDLHLADVEDHPDGWKAYKSSRFVFDGEFGSLVDDFVSAGESGDVLTLVLGGDIVDFDLVSAVPDDPPFPVSRSERKRGLDATEAKSVFKLRRVLGDHPEFLATLARFLAAGNRVVYVMGNHDRELHFPGVQKAFIDALEARARELSLSLACGTLTFEPWFFYVPGEIYVEHGHQYDFYTSFRYQLWPEVEIRGVPALALPMGNLSNRVLMSRMGFFNPHSGDFILNLFAYMWHWLRYYAFSRSRSLFGPWFLGSLSVVRAQLRTKKLLRAEPPEHAERLHQVARRYDLSAVEVRTLGQLQRQPITFRVYRMLRELWIDRVIMALLMTGGTVALALVPIPLWIKLMVPLCAFPLLYFIYEWLVQGETIFTMEDEIPRRARSVAQTLPARVIAFGHTHKPRQIPLCRETTFVDTGTWAPVYRGGDPATPEPGLRNYLHAAFDRRKVTLELGSRMPRHPSPQDTKPKKGASDHG